MLDGEVGGNNACVRNNGMQNRLVLAQLVMNECCIRTSAYQNSLIRRTRVKYARREGIDREGVLHLRTVTIRFLHRH